MFNAKTLEIQTLREFHVSKKKKNSRKSDRIETVTEIDRTIFRNGWKDFTQIRRRTVFNRTIVLQYFHSKFLIQYRMENVCTDLEHKCRIFVQRHKLCSQSINICIPCWNFFSFKTLDETFFSLNHRFIWKITLLWPLVIIIQMKWALIWFSLALKRWDKLIGGISISNHYISIHVCLNDSFICVGCLLTDSIRTIRVVFGRGKIWCVFVYTTSGAIIFFFFS